MLNLLNQLRRDEHGVILSSEIVVVGSLLVIGLITGTTCLQRSVDAELRDLGNAIGSLDQSYSFSGHRKSGNLRHCCAWTAGSSYLNCEAKDQCRNDLHGCEISVASGCTSCGQSACTGCAVSGVSQGVCGTCGGNNCSGGCGAVSMGVASAAAVPGVRVSETPLVSHPQVPMIPIVDPLMTPLADIGGIQENESCPEFARPVKHPCTNEGDIVIPDDVW